MQAPDDFEDLTSIIAAKTKERDALAMALVSAALDQGRYPEARDIQRLGALTREIDGLNNLARIH